MNFIFISPQFPRVYWNFCDRLKKKGVNVLGIGDTPYSHFIYADKLWQYYPALRFFYGSTVISGLNFLAKLAPFSEPLKLLEDGSPKMRPNNAQKATL